MLLKDKRKKRKRNPLKNKVKQMYKNQHNNQKLLPNNNQLNNSKLIKQDLNKFLNKKFKNHKRRKPLNQVLHQLLLKLNKKDKLKINKKKFILIFEQTTDTRF